MHPISVLRDFLERERARAGWRFWLLWVVMTNVGFGPGIALELLLFDGVNVYLATALQGVMQSVVLRRHLPERGLWALATAGGWLAGGQVATRVLDALLPERSAALHLFAFALVAGAVAGVPQWLVLRSYLPRIGWWWVPLAAVGWAVQFPGAVPGAVLQRFVPGRAPEGAGSGGSIP